MSSTPEDDRLILNGVIARELAARHDRRTVIGRVVGGAGLLAAVASGSVAFGAAAAQDDDDEDDDDDDDDDNSGHGGGDDDGGDDNGGGNDDEPVITGEIPAGSIEVRITDDDADAFQPGSVTIDLGQSVTFVNADDDDHSATGAGFDTGTIPPGGTATITYTEAGTFPYACIYHPEMVGTVAVRDADGNVPERAESTVPAGATAVRIADFAFVPATITVATGTTVAWTNDDTAPHTATATDGSFDSGVFDPGGSFAWEFTEPGTYEYRCDLHPAMTGTVEVTGSAAVADDESAAAPVGDPVGSWVMTLTPDDGTGLGVIRALTTLHADGTVVAALVPDGDAELRVGAAAHGAWEDDGADGYRATSVAFLLDGDGRYAGTLTIVEESALDATGDASTGSVRFEAIDTAGGSVATGSGAATGQRVGMSSGGGAGTPTPAATASVSASPSGSGVSLTIDEGDEATVTIVDFAFDPAELTVAAGTTVTWTNQDAAPHTASATDASFDTGRLDEGQSGDLVFDTPGTYPYLCNFHPEMTATVIVT